ncbi:MAG: hypothetical protein IJ763_05410 [Lachnospiraceae bacterium]|nr:hypothetical protein [Lachnospiraceae bacterium]
MLFETETRYTFEEYKRACNTKVLNQKIRITITVICLVCMVLWGINGIINIPGGVVVGLSCLFFAIIFPIIMIARYNYSVKKSYNTFAAIRDAAYHFTFFENKMEIVKPHGKSDIEYGEIYDIVETKTNFYILASSTTLAAIIVKANCSDELIVFIQNLKNKK